MLKSAELPSKPHTHLQTTLASFVLLITIGELSLAIPIPLLTLSAHLLATLLIVYTLILQAELKLTRLYFSLLIIPLIRIISIVIPISTWPRITWYIAISLPLFLAIGLVIQQTHWPLLELGHSHRNLLSQLAMAIFGFWIGLGQYFILKPDPLITELTWHTVWFPALVLLITTGYLEELLFRGLLLHAATILVGNWRGVLLTATLTALMQLSHLSLRNLASVFAIAVLYGVIVVRTRSLVGVTLMHGITNISLFLLWPFWLN